MRLHLWSALSLLFLLQLGLQGRDLGSDVVLFRVVIGQDVLLALQVFDTALNGFLLR
jgi:hypothetical protein